MAIRPTTPPRPTGRPPAVNRPGGLGRNSRPPAQNRPGGTGRGPNGRVVIPPRYPPPTGFQPGAPPSPPLDPRFALGGLLLAFGQYAWNLLNIRGKQVSERDVPFRDVLLPGGENRTITWSARTQRTFSPTVLFNGSTISPGSVNAPVTIGGTFSGVGIRVGATQGQSRDTLGGSFDPGASVMALQVLTADGPGAVLVEIEDGRTNPTGFTTRTVTDTVTGLEFSDGANSAINEVVTDFPIPEEVQPEPGAIPAAALLASPGGVPLPALPPAVPLPAAVPDGDPVPVPSPAPGGLPGRAPAPSPAPRPGTAPSPGPAAVPTTPAPRPITGGQVQAPPAPQPRPTLPGTTFLPGGIELPSNGPPATMQGIATEVGKLERKLEILLQPEGPPSLLSQFNRIIDQIENIRFLLDNLFPPGPYTFPDGEFQLEPVCERDADGNPLPPVTVPWAGGEGESLELSRKLDALAQLLQVHKRLKQPTCGSRGGGAGGNVTVHFESG